MLVGVAISGAAATSAGATDIVVMPPAPPTAPAAPPPAFAWGGGYAGAATAVMFCGGFCWVNVDAHVGYNFVSGNFLAGVEGQVGYWYNTVDDDWYFGASARAGYVLGSVVPYAEVGIIGYGPVAIAWYLSVMGGVEVAVGGAISIFAEAGVQLDFGGFVAPAVGIGVNWHFGH
jgi:hypothetical protein